MPKRLITVIFVVAATFGLAAAPAQAKTVKAKAPSVSVSDLAKPMGWEWGGF